uniref:(northern house mosquito) hypothetical protein n=1 Tax=Culex pipiens TaxID=7175 RepID=A0A8D8FTR6_CULPI
MFNSVFGFTCLYRFGMFLLCFSCLSVSNLLVREPAPCPVLFEEILNSVRPYSSGLLSPACSPCVCSQFPPLVLFISTFCVLKLTCLCPSTTRYSREPQTFHFTPNNPPNYPPNYPNRSTFLFP